MDLGNSDEEDNSYKDVEDLAEKGRRDMELELKYVDDPFEDDSWKYPETSMQRAVLQAGKRKYFKQGERKRFEGVEKKMRIWRSSDQVFDTSGKLLFYPTQFVLDIINWCKTTNDKAGRPTIRVPTIIGMCLDTDRVGKWLTLQKIEKGEDRSGYASNDDEWD